MPDIGTVGFDPAALPTAADFIPLGAAPAVTTPNALDIDLGGVLAGGITVSVADIFRANLSGSVRKLLDLQLGFNLIATVDNGLATVGDLLGRILDSVTLAGDDAGAAVVPSLQADVDDVLTNIDDAAQKTSFGGDFLLKGSVPQLTIDIDRNAPEGTAVVALPDVRTSRLGTAEGGATLASLASGGENALAVNPAGAQSVVVEAQTEVAAARTAIGDLEARVLAPALEQDQVALANLASIDRAGTDRSPERDALAQALGQNLMAASLLAVVRGDLSRERMVELMAQSP